ncbi:M3 family metallopeptidase [Bdellovibrio bacteriovorus]|uniref:Peptidyl-dipeptidase n=1 Tax=Bdellovibrio bacteriovorus (strain ATCC 15356 / DSM 50701 / NCIMB 9529 / HD100) TaxID=264462 RepID=Q6MII6_BDEBA|nr:M3 family metallopeptidase [Bdellovibrio bacteriovorus]CAE80927.1 peptidyl-dipeptidase [Bdellovibrio bacteriovorus HD100]
MNTTNPLLQPFKNKDQAVPFDLIKVEHYVPAVEEAIKMAKENVAKIKANPEAPDFENTIVALEAASVHADQISTIYSNLEVAHADEALQALAKDIYPMLTALSSDISLDSEIFARVKAVYDKRESLNLNLEQTRLLEKTYLSFTRNGALLNAADKETLRQIDQELSVLGPKFSENVLKATNSFEMLLDKKEDVDGLPEGTLEGAAALAKAKGHDGKWIFNLQIPSYLPFMTYAKNRALREKMWRAFSSKAFKGEFDNQANVLKIVELRDKRAKVLKFTTHADFVLAERMAKNPKTVMDFLNKLLAASKNAGLKDVQELTEFANKLDGLTEIKPWDVAYYSEKLKEERYAFNEEDLRPYFKLENVVEGVFAHAKKLYGLTFKENKEIPVYHPEVKAYEIYEDASGKYMGLFYTDYFPRETKKGGAWMTQFRSQGLIDGEMKRPHVSIVCNFTQPTPTKPSLLTYDEVRTLFHEFGHALHGMLSECTYPSLSGTNVYWDFVELPSQIMENWVGEKEGLDIFARHYETNEPMPAELIEKLKRSQKFQAGYMSCRQLQFGLMDMAWHSTDPGTIKDVDAFEELATAETRLFPKVDGANSSCSFGHIFAGGYSAGYYSYKWAEVLDADAFEYFKEKGLFNQEVAKKFKDNVLSRGGTEHPMDLYKKFRGREPDPNALLRRDGLI